MADENIEVEEKRSPTGALAGGDKAITPKMKREIEVMRTATIKLLHGKETQAGVLDMLKSGPIDQSLPATALRVTDMLESSMKPKADIVLANSVTLVSDLFEIADASGIAPTPDEESIKGIYQDTLQKYIQRGLKDGSIDPVELQKSIEPLMSDEQKNAGGGMMKQHGLPEQATSSMATDRLVKEAVAKTKNEQGLLTKGGKA